MTERTPERDSAQPHEQNEADVTEKSTEDETAAIEQVDGDDTAVIEQVDDATETPTAVIPAEPATEVIDTRDEAPSSDATQVIAAEPTEVIDAQDETPRADTTETVEAAGSDTPTPDPYPSTEPAVDPQPGVNPQPAPEQTAWTAAPAQTWTPEPAPVAPRARGPRSGTVIWGLVVVALGTAILAAAAGFRIDFQLAFIALLATAGVALLISSLVSAVRRRDRSAS